MSDDLELLDQWCAGDLQAGNALFQRYFDNVCRFFEHKVSGEVDELVQATFMACVDGRSRLRTPATFRTYVFAVARQEFYRHVRAHAHDRGALDFGATSLSDLGTTPTARAVHDDNQRRLLAALRAMPIDQQILLELYFWEGMTEDELAEVFEISREGAAQRLACAREDLRAAIEELAGSMPSMRETVSNLDEWARKIRARRDDDQRDQ